MASFQFANEDTVLFVGEGNFSLSRSLVSQLEGGGAPDITATCLELEDEKDSEERRQNVGSLRRAGAAVLFGVDATQLEKDARLEGKSYSRIVFMFPHVGGKMKIQLNRALLAKFFNSAKLLLKSDGELIVTLARGQGGTPAEVVARKREDTWQLVETAAEAGLVLVKAEIFEADRFAGYTSVGYRGLSNKGFHLEAGIVHSLRAAPLPELTPLPCLSPDWPLLPLSRLDDHLQVRSDQLCKEQQKSPVSLYPPTYTHHLSFWLPDSETVQQMVTSAQRHHDHQPLTAIREEALPAGDRTAAAQDSNSEHFDRLIATVVVRAGAGYVRGLEFVDRYVDSGTGRTSRTVSLTYRSDAWALGRTSAFRLHYDVVGRSLANCLAVRLR